MQSPKIENNPLVSIIVITYNSAKYVLETLESAKAQTYQNIELIISDDASTDNTVEICRQWVEENKERFVRTEIITVPENTGIPANCNRGVKAAKGEWVKLIAGDDILYYSCVTTFMNSKTTNSKILLCELIDFENDLTLNLSEQNESNNINPLFIQAKNAQEQFIYFLKGNYIPGSATFFERNKMLEMDLFDEEYPFVEDRPLFLKYNFNNIKIEYISDVLVAHRRHEMGLTARNNVNIVPKYLIQVYKAILYYAELNKKFIYIFNAKWHLIFFDIISKLGNQNRLCFMLNQIRIKLQPIRFYNLLNKLKI